MAITAKNEGTDFKPVDAGNYVARCYSMVHLGTTEEEITSKGITKKVDVNKVRISWELPNELRVFKEENGEQPLVISEDYSLSTYENSNLRKMMESWRGEKYTEAQAKEIDVTKLIGQPCMLNVIHNTSKKGKVYAKVGAVSPLPKGFVCPPQINPSFEWNFEEKYSLIELEKMPAFIQDRIKASNEWKAINEVQDKEVIQQTSQEADKAMATETPFTDEMEQDQLPF